LLQIPFFEPCEKAGQREIIVSWICREMFYGVKNGLLTSKLKCTLATHIREQIGGFHAQFSQNQPNLWTALMVFVVDLLVLLFVLGTSFQVFLPPPLGFRVQGSVPPSLHFCS
jgi:hypothetical protein